MENRGHLRRNACTSWRGNLRSVERQSHQANHTVAAGALQSPHTLGLRSTWPRRSALSRRVVQENGFTFSDAIGAVRGTLWNQDIFRQYSPDLDIPKIQTERLRRMTQSPCLAVECTKWRLAARATLAPNDLSLLAFSESFACGSSQVVIKYVTSRGFVRAPVNMVARVKDRLHDHRNTDNRAKSDYCHDVLKNSTYSHSTTPATQTARSAPKPREYPPHSNPPFQTARS